MLIPMRSVSRRQEAKLFKKIRIRRRQPSIRKGYVTFIIDHLLSPGQWFSAPIDGACVSGVFPVYLYSRMHCTGAEDRSCRTPVFRSSDGGTPWEGSCLSSYERSITVTGVLGPGPPCSSRTASGGRRNFDPGVGGEWLSHYFSSIF